MHGLMNVKDLWRLCVFSACPFTLCTVSWQPQTCA